jgi:hypothetical protein
MAVCRACDIAMPERPCGIAESLDLLGRIAKAMVEPGRLM